MRTSTVVICLSMVVLFLTGDVSTVPVSSTKDNKDNSITGRASMLGRFEPIVNQVVVPFLVATGVVSLVRMVPGMVSSLPGVFGFAKRHGYEEVPKEFYDIMQMLDGAVVKYADQHNQRPAVGGHHAQQQHTAYPAYHPQYQAQASTVHAQQVAAAAAASAQSAQKQQTQKTHLG